MKIKNWLLKLGSPIQSYIQAACSQQPLTRKGARVSSGRDIDQVVVAYSQT